MDLRRPRRLRAHSGAIVAKQPERSRHHNTRAPGGDIAPALMYDEPISEAAKEDVTEAKRRLGAGHYDRPWLGAVEPRTRSSTTTATAPRCAGTSSATVR
ncbi:hypothetical protein GCM10020218_002240 [Dactylosporangium vinaceum]